MDKEEHLYSSCVAFVVLRDECFKIGRTALELNKKSQWKAAGKDEINEEMIKR